MLSKLWQNKIVRFLICGGVTAAFNVLLIASIIEFWRIEQPVLRNIANLVSIEVSLVFSFFVYRAWVWSKGRWTFKDIMLRQMPLYHLSCGASVATRVLILFPTLDWLGFNPSVNTFVGIVAGSAMNYVMSDKFVFQSKKY